MKFLANIWAKIFGGFRADPREVAAIVERAWIDNVEAYGLGGARAWVLDEFLRNVGTYVREHYARTGTYPCGEHNIMGRGYVHFAPRAVWYNPGRSRSRSRSRLSIAS